MSAGGFSAARTYAYQAIDDEPGEFRSAVDRLAARSTQE